MKHKESLAIQHADKKLAKIAMISWIGGVVGDYI